MTKTELESAKRELTFREAWIELDRENLATPFLQVFREYTQGRESTYQIGGNTSKEVWIVGEAFISGYDICLAVWKSSGILKFAVYPLYGDESSQRDTKNHIVKALEKDEDPADELFSKWFVQAEVTTSLKRSKEGNSYYAETDDPMELHSPATTPILDILSRLHRSVLQMK